MISSKTKNEYKEKLHQGYSKRKFFNIITLFLLMCYIVFIIISLLVSGGLEIITPFDIYGNEKIMGLYLSPYGWSMLFIGVALLVAQIVSIVLIWTSIDPRTASEMQKQVSARERLQRRKSKFYNKWEPVVHVVHEKNKSKPSVVVVNEKNKSKPTVVVLNKKKKSKSKRK